MRHYIQECYNALFHNSLVVNAFTAERISRARIQLTYRVGRHPPSHLRLQATASRRKKTTAHTILQRIAGKQINARHHFRARPVNQEAIRRSIATSADKIARCAIT